jgi:hypothetical protein
VPIVLSVACAVLGLLAGGVIGYALGRKVVGNRTRFWLCAGGLVGACVVADYVGIVGGYHLLSIASLCAMAGAITGLKYGGLPEVRIWETRPSLDDNPAEHGDASESEDSDA